MLNGHSENAEFPMELGAEPTDSLLDVAANHESREAERPLSTTSADTGYHGDTDSTGGRSETSPAPYDVTFNVLDDKQAMEVVPEEKEEPVIGDGILPTTPMTNGTVESAKTPTTKTKKKEEQIQKRESVFKKSTASRLAAESPKLVKPRAPKPPSKHEQIMAQLKASMAADKNKPKAKIESKVTAALKQRSPEREPSGKFAH